MEREGSPTETDFLQYHTRLLIGVLNTPLTMSGTQTLPLDLIVVCGAYPAAITSRHHPSDEPVERDA